jgi:hypothetical protein
MNDLNEKREFFEILCTRMAKFGIMVEKSWLNEIL